MFQHRLVLVPPTRTPRQIIKATAHLREKHDGASSDGSSVRHIGTVGCSRVPRRAHGGGQSYLSKGAYAPLAPAVAAILSGQIMSHGCRRPRSESHYAFFAVVCGPGEGTQSIQSGMPSIPFVIDFATDPIDRLPGSMNPLVSYRRRILRFYGC